LEEAVVRRASRVAHKKFRCAPGTTR